MTIDISDNDPRIEYTVAQGATQTVFTVPFEFFEDSDVRIYVDGTLKSLGSNYTLSGGDGSTGTATFVQPVTGATGGSTVSVVRHISLERTTDFPAGQEINRAVLNEQLDTITAQIADLDNKVDRTIHLNDYEVAPSTLLTEDRKGKTLAFNLTTGAVEAGPLSSDVAVIANNITAILAVNGEAAAAASSATAAAGSATASAASAVDATNNGAAQVALAAGQVTLATTAKTAAELAETNAETAETNAATSATNAATSETNASTSASTASTKASEAATSATNSATSATESETAKTAAEAAKDAALAALDSFDDRYLGAKASDPTLDNDGNALVAGALYYNTTDDVMKVYEGSVWVAAYASLSGALLTTNNLSDLTNATTARTNLGLGTAATTASTDYATAAQGTLAASAVQPNDSPTFSGLDVIGGTNTTIRTVIGGGDQALLVVNGDRDNDGDAGPEDSAILLETDGVYSSSINSGFGNYGYRIGAINSGGVTGLKFTEAKAGSDIERMRIDTNGRVGIGNTNPATALDVTGTITSDGLTVDGAATGEILIKAADNAETTYPLVIENSANSIDLGIGAYGLDNTIGVSQGSDFKMNVGRDIIMKSDDKTYFKMGTGGDISFYEDTGTTAKFFWDASTERLGIGATTVDSQLHVEKSDITAYNGSATDGQLTAGATAFVQQTGGSNSAISQIVFQPRDGYGYNRIVNSGGSAPYMALTTNNAEAMRIDSSGNVGINTTNPATPLDVNGTITSTALTLGTWTITDTGGVLTFSSGGGAKFSINAAGAITAADNVIAYGTP